MYLTFILSNSVNAQQNKCQPQVTSTISLFMTFIETYLKSIGKFLSQSGRQEKRNVGVLTLAWMWAHSPYNYHGYPL